MRAYRFVNELGQSVDTAGRAVAKAAAVTSSHQGGLGGNQSANRARVGGELLRQLTRETNGREFERVEFESRGVRPNRIGSDSTDHVFEIALLIEIELPSYRSVNIAQASVLHTSQLPPEGAGNENSYFLNSLETLLDRTDHAYVFLVDRTETRVVPARSISAMTEPVTQESIGTHLYGRSLGRFVEELAEGFVGVGQSSNIDSNDSSSVHPAEDPMDESAIREWGTEIGVDGVFSLRVVGTQDQLESSLSAYFD